jgi:hypothetical protein
VKKKSAREKASARHAGTVKRSFTISRELDERAHDLVGVRGYSALVNEALREKLQSEATKSIIAAYEAKHGPIPEELRRRARKKIRDAGLW